jgi:16S rRNA G966 N2-methylase RsmD
MKIPLFKLLFFSMIECLLDFIFSDTSTDNLASSGFSTYGENTRKSHEKLFTLLQEHFHLTQKSIFLDIGSGRGIPSFVAASFPVAVSLGVEMDENVFTHSQKLLHDFLQLASYEKGCTRIHFECMDATHLQLFDPVTHIYAFDLAMPPETLQRLVQVFNKSESVIVYCSYRKNLIETYGMNALLMDKVNMRMTHSGENHTLYVYARDLRARRTRRKAATEGPMKSSRGSLPTTVSISKLVEKANLPIKEKLEDLEKNMQKWIKLKKPRNLN